MTDHETSDRRLWAYRLGLGDARLDAASVGGPRGADQIGAACDAEDIPPEEVSALWLAYYHGRYAARPPEDRHE